MKGILPDILDLRGPLLRSSGSGGMMALSTSPSTMGTHVYRCIHNTIITCVRNIIPTIGLRVFGVAFGLSWAEINKEK